MPKMSSLWIAAPLTAVVLLLTGCDEAEQDRTLYYQQGEYQGKADTPLTPEQLDELRGRARLQQGS